MRPFVLILAVCGTATTIALAQEAEEPALDKVSIRTAVEKIARKGKVNILLGDGVEGEVAPPDGSLPWKDQLRAVEVEAGVEVWPLGDETFVVWPSWPMTIEIDNLPVSQALQVVSRTAGANVVAPLIPGRKVSVEVDGAPLREVFEDIARQSGLVMIRERGWVRRFSLPEEEERLARRPLSEEALAALGLARSEAKGKERITIDAKDEKAGDLLKRISESVGIPIRLGGPRTPPDWPKRTVSLKLVDAPWHEAVRAIAWRVHGYLWDDGKGEVRIQPDPAVTMEFQQADLGPIISLIAENAGVRIESPKRTNVLIALNLRVASGRHVIYLISRSGPFDLEVKPDGTLVAKPF